MKRLPLAFFLIVFSTTVGFCASEVVAISGGTFNMGSNSGDNDEKPLHSITLDDYKIDKRPASNKDYDECVAAGKCSKPNYKNGSCFLWTNNGLSKITPPAELLSPDNPVVCISWKQANDYCKFRGSRLPTEAEWEFAATNGGKTAYSWGNEKPTPDKATFGRRSSVSVYTNKAVGKHNLIDMNGNVWEWVSDRYEQNYYEYSQPKNPKGAPVGRFNVIRGGGWYSDDKALRSANRQWFSPEASEISIGVRCAK